MSLCPGYPYNIIAAAIIDACTKIDIQSHVREMKGLLIGASISTSGNADLPSCGLA